MLKFMLLSLLSILITIPTEARRGGYVRSHYRTTYANTQLRKPVYVNSYYRW